MSEVEDLGAALARTVSALEGVHLESLQPEDIQRLEKPLTAARTALAEYRRAMRNGEEFTQED